MLTHTRGTWCNNRDSRAWEHGGGSAVSIEQLAVVGERISKGVVARGDIKGAGNIVESIGKG